MPQKRSKTPRNNYNRPKASRKKNPDNNPKVLAGVVAAVVVGIVVWLVASAKSPEANDEMIAGATGTTSLLDVVALHEPEQEIVEYPGFIVSFNRETHQPNWVAWELTAEETRGRIARDSIFTTDETVAGCATTSDYTRSGYDRGHMAPAGDMKWSRESMEASFRLTNICPQVGELNHGPWQKLEEKCRQKAQADSAIIIVCGPIFREGEAVERIGRTQVAVPRQFFKVVLSPYTDPPTAIGFIMPNSRVVGSMQQCAVSVDSVEALTGYDFFSALPDDIENQIESRCDYRRWSRNVQPKRN